MPSNFTSADRNRLPCFLSDCMALTVVAFGTRTSNRSAFSPIRQRTNDGLLANEFRNDLYFLVPRTAWNIQRAEHERFALDQG
jgi:hypothetical protein